LKRHDPPPFFMGEGDREAVEGAGDERRPGGASA